MDAFSRIAEWVQFIGYALLFLSVAPLFPFLYVVLRWRSGTGREPGTGTYGALLYFCTVSFLLALAGAANLTYGVFSTTPVDEKLNRLSWGMLAGSLLFLAVNGALAIRLRAGHEFPEARRVFLGFLTVLAGLVGFAALVMFCVTAFEDVEQARVELRTDELKLYGSWAAYFLVAYLGAMVRLAKGMR